MVIERQKFFLSSNEKGMSKTELGKLERVGQIISTNELNYLRDAQKMKIVLINQDDGTEVVQTVGLEAMGDDSEFGLRSEKLQLRPEPTRLLVSTYLKQMEQHRN